MSHYDTCEHGHVKGGCFVAGCSDGFNDYAPAPKIGRPHIVDGEFQSDKYPTCPPGKVPLSVKDPMAQDLLWAYAQRRRTVDVEFANDLEFALEQAGYPRTHPPHPLALAENDSDDGRYCLRCGLPVPGGYKHTHAVWCQAREEAASCLSNEKPKH